MPMFPASTQPTMTALRALQTHEPLDLASAGRHLVCEIESRRLHLASPRKNAADETHHTAHWLLNVPLWCDDVHATRATYNIVHGAIVMLSRCAALFSDDVNM